MLKKVYPPAGYFLSPLKLFFSILSSREITADYQNQQVFLYNSAKTALYVLFKAIKDLGYSKPIAVSAFTCPDVISSILKAGMSIKLLDVEPNDVRIRVTQEKVKDCCAVVLSNLYGLVDIIEDVGDLIIIDDRCQSALSYNQGTQEELNNRISIYSFGRGKAYSGAGGGMLCVPKRINDLHEKIINIHSKLNRTSFVDLVSHIVLSILLWLFQKPKLYSLISSLSFLNLGKTEVIEDFSLKVASPLYTKIFYAYKKNAVDNLINLAQNAKNYDQYFISKKVKSFSPTKKTDSEVLIRYPIIFSDHLERNSFYKNNKDFGVSLSYNTTLLDLFPSETLVNSRELFPNAIDLSKKLLTLSLVPNFTEEELNSLFN